MSDTQERRKQEGSFISGREPGGIFLQQQQFQDIAGGCLFCLRRINLSLNSDLLEETFSLRSLCRNLKLNLEDVIPPTTPTGTTNGRVPIALCEVCSELTGKFSELYQLQEIIQMRMNNCLESIRKNVVKGNENQGALDQFRNLVINSRGPQVQLQNVEKFRKDLLRKCSKKFAPGDPSTSEPTPLGAQQHLQHQPGAQSQPGEAYAYTFYPNHFLQSQIPPEIRGDPLAEVGFAAVNEVLSQQHHRSQQQHQQQNLKVFAAPGTPAPRGRGRPGIPTGRAPSSAASSTTSNSTKFRFTVMLDGKVKCDWPDCEKLFVHKTGYYTHFNSVHLGVRFECPRCQKEFAYRSTLKNHENVCGRSTDPGGLLSLAKRSPPPPSSASMSAYFN